MNALDLILIETALPAAGLLLYALFLDVHETLTRSGLLPVVAADKSMRSIHVHTSKSAAVQGRTAGFSTHQDTQRAA